MYIGIHYLYEPLLNNSSNTFTILLPRNTTKGTKAKQIQTRRVRYVTGVLAPTGHYTLFKHVARLKDNHACAQSVDPIVVVYIVNTTRCSLWQCCILTYCIGVGLFNHGPYCKTTTIHKHNALCICDLCGPAPHWKIVPTVTRLTYVICASTLCNTQTSVIL